MATSQSATQPLPRRRRRLGGGAGLRGLPLSLLLTLAVPAALLQAPAPAAAQGSRVDASFDRIEQLQQEAAARQRAINLARNTAVRLNGGLGLYVPAACMFASGSRSSACLVEQSSRGFRFRFSGGPPGWEQQGQAATVSTDLWISPDGRRVGEVVYNGPLR
jgi:hypothetical protein